MLLVTTACVATGLQAIGSLHWPLVSGGTVYRYWSVCDCSGQFPSGRRTNLPDPSGPSPRKASVMLRHSVVLFSSCGHAPDLLGEVACLCICCSAHTHFTRKLRFLLICQSRVTVLQMEGLSNTDSIYLPSPSNPEFRVYLKQGSQDWITEEGDGSKRHQPVLCGYNKIPGARKLTE